MSQRGVLTCLVPVFSGCHQGDPYLWITLFWRWGGLQSQFLWDCYNQRESSWQTTTHGTSQIVDWNTPSVYKKHLICLGASVWRLVSPQAWAYGGTRRERRLVHSVFAQSLSLAPALQYIPDRSLHSGLAPNFCGCHLETFLHDLALVTWLWTLCHRTLTKRTRVFKWLPPPPTPTPKAQ